MIIEIIFVYLYKLRKAIVAKITKKKNMSKRIEIIGNSLVVTDTITSKIELDVPKSEYYYNLKKLQESGVISFYNKDSNDNLRSSPQKIKLSEAVDKDNLSFTESSLIGFCRLFLGFNIGGVSGEGLSSVPLWESQSDNGEYLAKEIINYDGVLYTNRTGINTDVSPDLDPDNWEVAQIYLTIKNQSTSAQPNSSAWISGTLKVNGDAIFDSNVSVRELSSIATTSSNLIDLKTELDGGRTGIKARTNNDYGFDIFYDDAQTALGRGLFVNSVEVIDDNVEVKNILYIDRSSGKSTFNFEVSAPTYKVTDLETFPTDPQAAGNKGDIRYSANYIYLCVNTNTWKRVGFGTWL
jgi:hypothetical protein